MRVYFYGALLLAVSILLASYGGGTPRTNSALSAISDFATRDTSATIITNMSSDDFDHALARITSVKFIGGERGHKPMAAGADTVDSLAPQDSFYLLVVKPDIATGDEEQIGTGDEE